MTKERSSGSIEFIWFCEDGKKETPSSHHVALQAPHWLQPEWRSVGRVQGDPHVNMQSSESEPSLSM